MTNETISRGHQNLPRLFNIAYTPNQISLSGNGLKTCHLRGAFKMWACPDLKSRAHPFERVQLHQSLSHGTILYICLPFTNIFSLKASKITSLIFTSMRSLLFSSREPPHFPFRVSPDHYATSLPQITS